jgi:hypothetical protein
MPRHDVHSSNATSSARTNNHRWCYGLQCDPMRAHTVAMSARHACWGVLPTTVLQARSMRGHPGNSIFERDRVFMRHLIDLTSQPTPQQSPGTTSPATATTHPPTTHPPKTDSTFAPATSKRVVFVLPSSECLSSAVRTLNLLFAFAWVTYVSLCTFPLCPSHDQRERVALQCGGTVHAQRHGCCGCFVRNSSPCLKVSAVLHGRPLSPLVWTCSE